MTKPRPPARLSILPSQLQVLGATFRVEIHDSAEELYGYTDVGKHLIAINKQKHETTDQLRATLLHEGIHAMFGAAGLTELLSVELEEALVRLLENNLPQLLVQLPGVDWRQLK